MTWGKTPINSAFSLRQRATFYSPEDQSNLQEINHSLVSDESKKAQLSVYSQASESRVFCPLRCLLLFSE